MRTSRRRFVQVGVGLIGAVGVPLLAGCGEKSSGGVQGWASSDVSGSEVQQGQPGGLPDARTRVGLEPGVIVLTAVQISGEDSIVRLTNLNTANMTMIGWQLCSAGEYWEIPDITMEPDQVLDIAYGSGPDTVEQNFMNGAISLPDPAGGELALYASNKFDRASAMNHYVQWGVAGGQREELAVKAEVWEAGAFVDATPLADGGVLEYDGRIPGQGNWSARAGTL
jgi:hypothetical protein